MDGLLCMGKVDILYTSRSFLAMLHLLEMDRGYSMSDLTETV